MIDIRLKVFQSVALNLSFSRAAQELYISQPAVSKHIGELEKAYNCRLFERMGGRIALTASGHLLLSHVDNIMKAYQKLDYDMNALQQKAMGELRIGASTTISQYVMPEVIAKFREQYPDIHIVMLSGNSKEVEKALMDNRIDLGMVEGVLRQPQLKYTPFLDDQLVPIVSCKGALAKLNSLSLDELKKIPLVIREMGSGTLDVMGRALSKHHVALADLNIEMNLGTTEGIKHYVEHSACMGIVSTRSVVAELANGTLKTLKIDGVEMGRQLMMVEKQGEATRVQQKFKDYIIKSYI